MAIAKKPVAKKTVATPAKKTTASRTVAPKTPPAENIAKQVSLIISVGNEDRDRDFQEFVDAVIKAIQTSKTAKVKRVVQGGGHYILDGKVCLPDDFDPKTKNFKPGKTPPPWAGGPAPKSVVEKTTPKAEESRYLTREEADRRIAAAKSKYASQKAADDDVDEFEDFTEWEAEDANDHEALTKVADESIATTKKRTIKKSASAKPAPATKKVPPRRRKSV